MIDRKDIARLDGAFRAHPVAALLGPRQCGKSTMARQFASKARGPVHYFDLENPRDIAKFDHPQLLLEKLEGLVVIDEVQSIPPLFPLLRVLVDRPLPRRRKPRFLILGSASRDLIRQGSETLAGRIQYVELAPFNLSEVGPEKLERLWLRGGFPRSFLARSMEESVAWRQSFVTSYLERDIPTLGLEIPAASLRRFWMMLAHYHGQVFNASEIGRSLGLADTTVRRYLDILTGTFMVRQLYPWVENIGKRQVKSAKVFFRDSGMFHALLGVDDRAALNHHPKLGASWEGFALEEIIRLHHAPPEESYFWATHSEAELDLMILKGGERLGYEVKYTETPRFTKSMRIAMHDLRLSRLTIVVPGEDSFPLGKNVEAVGLKTFLMKNTA